MAMGQYPGSLSWYVKPAFGCLKVTRNVAVTSSHCILRLSTAAPLQLDTDQHSRRHHGTQLVEVEGHVVSCSRDTEGTGTVDALG